MAKETVTAKEKSGKGKSRKDREYEELSALYRELQNECLGLRQEIREVRLEYVTLQKRHLVALDKIILIYKYLKENGISVPDFNVVEDMEGALK